MGLFTKETRERVLGKPEAVARHKAARANLERITRQDIAAGRDLVPDGESEEWLAANRAVADAERDVPKWRW